MFTLLEQLGRDELQFAVEYLEYLRWRLGAQGEVQEGQSVQEDETKR